MKSISIILCSLAACGFSLEATDSSEPTTPTVLSSVPVDGATGVSLGDSVSVTFSEAMDPETLTSSTFTLTAGEPAVPIAGTVVYADSTAVFTPAVALASFGSFTATITTDASSDAGVSLASTYVWSFTGSSAVPGIPVNLGTAGAFVVLAKGAISGTTATVTGNVGVSPAAATYITGFSLIADTSNTFSTSAQITGRVYAADYAVPTPALLTAAVSAMELAFTAAAARAPDFTEVGSGSTGGQVLVPGVYRWAGALLIPATLTLTGSATDVWIFQVGQDLTVSAGTRIVLAGGALPRNVFWQVSGKVTLAAMAHLEGIVLTQTSVTFGAGASLVGRLLAQTAITIDGSTIVQPAL